MLTHHEHAHIEMAGGTTLHFVAEAFEEALAMAQEAGGGDVDVAGGASAIRRAMHTRALDELTLEIVPVLLGSGERIFDADIQATLEQVGVEHAPWAAHVRYRIRYDQ